MIPLQLTLESPCFSNGECKGLISIIKTFITIINKM